VEILSLLVPKDEKRKIAADSGRNGIVTRDFLLQKIPHPPPSPKERELKLNLFVLCNFNT